MSKKKLTVAAIAAALMLVPLLGACSSGVNDSTKPQTEQQENASHNKKDSSHADKQTDQGVTVKPAALAESGNQKKTKQTRAEKEGKSERRKVIQEEALQAIREQLKTDLPKQLPGELPLKYGRNLTATTTSKDNSYEVVFYETDPPVPVNDPALPNQRKDARQIAKLKVTRYKSQETAQEQIGYEIFSKSGGKKIDLGHKITGYQDAGAGSSFISWNEGRWALSVRNQTDQAIEGEKLAKEAVQYLEDHRIPAPQRYGYIRMEPKSASSSAIWQHQNTVYELTEVDESMNVLRIVQAFE